MAKGKGIPGKNYVTEENCSLFRSCAASNNWLRPSVQIIPEEEASSESSAETVNCEGNPQDFEPEVGLNFCVERVLRPCQCYSSGCR